MGKKWKKKKKMKDKRKKRKKEKKNKRTGHVPRDLRVWCAAMAGSRCSSPFANDNNDKIGDTGSYLGKCDLDHQVYVGEPCVSFIVAYVSLSPLEPSWATFVLLLLVIVVGVAMATRASPSQGPGAQATGTCYCNLSIPL
uniref:Uncharacterized protein n=1 Tax=Oryza brachyantha TaxID=4533 RepID=J3N1D3_ORYBR